MLLLLLTHHKLFFLNFFEKTDTNYFLKLRLIFILLLILIYYYDYDYDFDENKNNEIYNNIY